jgi:MFS family permease
MVIIVAGFFSGLAPNYPSLLVLRTLCGFGVGGSTVPFDLLAEFLPNSYRGRFLIYIEYFWTIGSIFVAGMAWLFLSQSGWRILTMVTAIPVAIALIGSILILPESPRWLLSKGRRKEAEEVIRQACQINQTLLEDFSLAPLLETQQDNVPISEFLKPEQRKLSFPLWTVWLSFGFVYYGIILFVSRVFSESDDDDDDEVTCDFSYLDIFISAASEVIGVFVAGIVIDRSLLDPSLSVSLSPLNLSLSLRIAMEESQHKPLATVLVPSVSSSWG